MTYQNRVVFFFDILGFRDLVDKEFIKDQSKSEKIYKVFEFINQFYQDEIPDKYNPSKQITFFSDSIVISFIPDDPDTIFTTISTIQILLVNLANMGIVMRGGISVGHLCHDSKYLFGPAFINAYDIESNLAKFPRIICDDSIILLSQKGKPLHSAKQDLEIFTQIIREDDDDYWYIDYIGNIESMFDNGYEQIDYLSKIYTFIVENLKEGTKDCVLEKYKWMKQKYNDTTRSILSDIRQKEHYSDLDTYAKQLKLID